MSNKSNLLFPLQDNTSCIFGVEQRILQGEQGHQQIPGKVKGKCQGCKELTQSNRDRQQSSEPGEGEGRENVTPGCSIPRLGHQGGHSWSRGDNAWTFKACKTGQTPREGLNNRDIQNLS